MIKDVKLTANINGIDYSFMAYKVEPNETTPYGETIVNVYNNHNSDANYTIGYAYEESELSCISHEFYRISRKT